MRRAGIIGSRLLGLISSVGGLARAEPPQVLDYQVADGCPDGEWFRAELRDQGVPQRPKRSLNVRVERRVLDSSPGDAGSAEDPGFEYDGRLRYGVGDGAWERRLTSGSCTDLLSALAVSLGLQLESEAPVVAGELGATAPRSSSSSGVGPRSPESDLEYLPEAPPPAEPEGPDLSGAWMLGFGLGGALRLGVDPEPSAGVSVSLLLRSVRSGWGSGPVGAAFTLSPSVARESRVDGGTANWRSGWWATSVFLTPGTFLLPPHGRMGFAAAFHVGRYLPSGDGDGFAPQTLMFSELVLRGEQALGSWLLDAQLGLQLPVETVVISSSNEVLHRQRAGLTIGLGATWLGVVL